MQTIRYCLIINFLLLTLYSCAQDDEGWRGFHAGGIVQGTFTDLDIDVDDSKISTSYVVGYGGGGFLGYFFNEHNELRLELLYTSLLQDFDLEERKRTIHLSYLNIPLLFAWNFNYNKPVSFHIAAGPQLGINTGSDLDGEGESGIDTVQFELNVKPADIGIAYGAGIDFGIGSSRLVHFTIGFRGVKGLVDISDDSKTKIENNFYILERSKINTYSAYAGLSYKF